MRRFRRIAAQSLAPIVWMFFGRADKWWAWGIVAIVYTTLIVMGPDHDFGTLSSDTWKAIDILSFVLISGALTYRRRARASA